MDLFIERDALIRGLARVQGIVERRTTNHALAHVLLSARAGDERLRMTATDTTVTLIADYPARVEAEASLCVEAQYFFAIAKNLPESTVRLTVGKGGLDGNRLTVQCGAALYHLNTLPADEFPPIASRDSKSTMRVKAVDLRRLIEETVFSISTDDNRYGLNGAHLEEMSGEAGRRLRVVTTDGSRLSWSEAPFEGDFGMGRQMLLPRKALGEVRKMCEGVEGDWEITFGERSATFASEGITLLARLVDGEFPDYRQVLPAAFRRRVELPRDRFSDALKRVAIVATDRNHTVRFAFEEESAVLTAENVDLGDAREEVPAHLDGAPLVTGFNIKYFQDLMSATSSERLSLEMGEALDPCIVSLPGRDDCSFIVMPMRLD